MTPEVENILFFLIYPLICFLIFNSGIHDVITALATLTGTRSFPFRAILCTIIISSIPSYFILQSTNIQHQTWLDLFPNIAALSITDALYFILSAVFFTSLPTALGLYLNHPSFITPSILSFFMGYFFLDHQQSSPLSNTLLRTALLSYLIIPLVSGCITWCVHRVFIRGILYVDQENRLKRTLAWCAFIYPITFSISSGAALLRYLSFNSTLYRYIIDIICIASMLLAFLLAFISFRLFFRAWLKRRVFLIYPQEYSYYMERCERVEQGDREARGLGPIQNYYSSRNSLSNTNNNTLSSTLNSKAESLDNYSIYLSSVPVVSGVTAGKNALTVKRTEELFRPALVLLSIGTIITVAPTESLNLLSLLRITLQLQQSDNNIPFPYFIVAFILMILGPILFTRRCCSFIGREIIKSMSPSQGFSIQFGTLVSLLIGILLRLPTAPILYLLVSITAVGSTNDTPLPTDDPEMLAKSNGSFRRNISKIFLFWIISASTCFLAGYLSANFFLY